MNVLEKPMNQHLGIGDGGNGISEMFKMDRKTSMKSEKKEVKMST